MEAQVQREDVPPSVVHGRVLCDDGRLAEARAREQHEAGAAFGVLAPCLNVIEDPLPRALDEALAVSLEIRREVEQGEIRDDRLCRKPASYAKSFKQLSNANIPICTIISLQLNEFGFTHELKVIRCEAHHIADVLLVLETYGRLDYFSCFLGPAKLLHAVSTLEQRIVCRVVIGPIRVQGLSVHDSNDHF